MTDTKTEARVNEIGPDGSGDGASRVPRRSRIATIAAASATVLAAMALYNRHRTRQVERDHPPTGRFVTVGGARLHYLEKGEGPPVVLIHGNVVTAGDWAWSGVLDRVARTHRVVAFDRPGYGHSERPRGSTWTAAEQADLLAGAFDRLGIERPVVVGHSWGSLVALELALGHPGAAGGLVLLAGYYKPTPRADVLPVAPAALPGIGDALRHTVSPLLGAALLPLNLKAMFAPLGIPEPFDRAFPRGFPVRPSQIRAEAQDAATMVPAVVGMAGRARDLEIPVAIMAGTEDRVVGHEGHAEWFHDRVPGSVLRLVPGAGHMLHHAAPGLVAEAVEEVGPGRPGAVGDGRAHEPGDRAA